MTTITQRLMTAQEFWQLPEDGKRRELVCGEVVETMPPGGKHGDIAAEVTMHLRLWAKRGSHGCVGVESGFRLSRDPDTVRAPDVFFVRAERVPEDGPPDGFWALAPDLAVEVISPNESAVDVREKVREYFAAGTQLVWQVYVPSREIIAFTPDGLARTFGPESVLSAPDLLPGFSCTVAELFG